MLDDYKHIYDKVKDGIKKGGFELDDLSDINESFNKIAKEQLISKSVTTATTTCGAFIGGPIGATIGRAAGVAIAYFIKKKS